MTNDTPPTFESVVRRKFGLRLVEVRTELGISQEKLSHLTGISRSYMSGIELGKRKVSLPIICILAKALSIHPSELLKFDVDDDRESFSKADEDINND
jgi:transcriptional regulator with XRE-family HTH domain